MCRFAASAYDSCVCGLPKQKRSATCSRCFVQTGSANANWKGGKTYHRKGYVLVKTRDHPKATKNGYAFEHVLVMEAMLGRFLVPGETVHHRNGVKDDNRPENLELWIKPQPSGIRASDAIAWAHEILARYEGAGAPPTSFSDPCR